MDERTRWAGVLLTVLGPLLLVGAVRDPGPPDPAEILRSARNAWEAGDTSAALQALQPLERGPLADHVGLLRARWLRRSGQLESAEAAALEALAHDPPSEVRSLVYLELAGIHLQRSQLGAAYRAQESAWRASQSSARSAELALDFAKVFESRALPGDARRLYDRIWQTWPRSTSGATAFERGRFLSEATGAPDPDPNSLIKYGDALRAAYLCERGLPVYELALERELDPHENHRAQRHSRAVHHPPFEPGGSPHDLGLYQRSLSRSPIRLWPAPLSAEIAQKPPTPCAAGFAFWPSSRH